MKASPKKTNQLDQRKSMQLCRQVARAVEYALSSDCSDDRLLGLAVVNVLPAPNTGHLLVIVQCTDEEMTVSAEELQAALHANSGSIRTAVATSISRRRTPTLTFQVLPPTSVLQNGALG